MCVHATLFPSDWSESERKREGERVRKREREIKRERGRKREGERDVEYGCFIFIFKTNDGCTF